MHAGSSNRCLPAESPVRSSPQTSRRTTDRPTEQTAHPLVPDFSTAAKVYAPRWGSVKTDFTNRNLQQHTKTKGHLLSMTFHQFGQPTIICRLLICIRIAQQVAVLPPHPRDLQAKRKPVRIEAPRNRHRRNSNAVHPACLAVRPCLRRSRNRLVVGRNLERRIDEPIKSPLLHRLFIDRERLALRPPVVSFCFGIALQP